MNDLVVVWNVILSGIVSIMGFLVKGKFDELDRLGRLMNRTREEVARDHITRAEYSRDLERLGERFEAGILRLEAKLDGISKRV
jgi:hypothetical protein